MITRPVPEEFVQLPYFPWDTRPSTVPLDADECATAIYLANGKLDRAAELLKIDQRQLKKMIRRIPRLRHLLVRLARGCSGGARQSKSPDTTLKIGSTDFVGRPSSVQEPQLTLGMGSGRLRAHPRENSG